MKYIIQRWTGSGWSDSLCSPYKTMTEVNKHLEAYSWHYTVDNPYRIKDLKEEKVQKYVPKYNEFHAWNTDKGMVTKI